jgi:hypothetical protein
MVTDLSMWGALSDERTGLSFVRVHSRLPEIYDYIGNKKETEDRKSVPVASPEGQNEPPKPIGPLTHKPANQ